MTSTELQVGSWASESTVAGTLHALCCGENIPESFCLMASSIVFTVNTEDSPVVQFVWPQLQQTHNRAA
jgi:hypothetical protein